MRKYISAHKLSMGPSAMILPQPFNTAREGGSGEMTGEACEYVVLTSFTHPRSPLRTHTNISIYAITHKLLNRIVYIRIFYMVYVKAYVRLRCIENCTHETTASPCRHVFEISPTKPQPLYILRILLSAGEKAPKKWRTTDATNDELWMRIPRVKPTYPASVFC